MLTLEQCDMVSVALATPILPMGTPVATQKMTGFPHYLRWCLTASRSPVISSFSSAFCSPFGVCLVGSLHTVSLAVFGANGPGFEVGGLAE